DGAVQQVAREAFALENLEVVGQVEPVVGGDLQRHPLDLRRGFQRRDRHPEEREEDNDGAAGDGEGNEPAEVDLPDAEGGAGRQFTRCNDGTHVSRKSNNMTRDPSLEAWFFSTRRVFGRFAIAAR